MPWFPFSLKNLVLFREEDSVAISKIFEKKRKAKDEPIDLPKSEYKAPKLESPKFVDLVDQSQIDVSSEARRVSREVFDERFAELKALESDALKPTQQLNLNADKIALSDLSEMDETSYPTDQKKIAETEQLKIKSLPSSELSTEGKKTDFTKGMSYIERWWEDSTIKGEFKKALTENFNSEKEILDDSMKTLNKWYKEKKDELEDFHIKKPVKKVTDINRGNLEDYKNLYKDKKYFLVPPKYSQEQIPCIAEILVRDQFNNKCEEKRIKLEKLVDNCHQVNDQLHQQFKTKKDSCDRVDQLNSQFKNQLSEQDFEIRNQEELISNQEKMLDACKQETWKMYDQAEKAAKYSTAHVRKLEKEIGRVHRVTQSLRERDLFSKTFLQILGLLIEIILEVCFFPFAAYNENSYLNGLLKQIGINLSWDKRWFLSSGLGIIWIGLALLLFSAGKSMIMIETKKVSYIPDPDYVDDDEDEFSLPKNLRTPKPHLNFRGGAQVTGIDPSFLFVRMIRVQGQLKDLGLAPCRERRGSKIIKRIRRRTPGMLKLFHFSVIIYLSSLNPRASISCQGPDLNLNMRTLEYVSSSSKPTFEPGPTSEPVVPQLLDSLDDPKSQKDNQKIIGDKLPERQREREWNSKKRKKRVGKLSDFSSKEFTKEFDDAEIIEALPVQRREKIKIK